MNDSILTPEQIAHNQRPLTKKDILILDLQDAQGKIKQGWCQFKSAKDASGVAINADNPAAVCWCLIGACFASTNGEYDKAYPLIEAIKKANNILYIASFNDETLKSQDEAVAALDKTISFVRTKYDDDLNKISP